MSEETQRLILKFLTNWISFNNFADKISLTDIDKDLAMETLGTKLSQQALKHPDMQALMMNDTVHFDVIIAQWYYTGLLAP